MQSEPASAPPIECCGVICEERRLMEIEHGSVAVLIPRQDLQQIALRNGFQSPHPIIQFLLGVCLVSLGVIPILHLIDWALHGGTLFDTELWVVAFFVVIGICLICAALRRGLFFEVRTPSGTKRLAFHKHPDPQILDAFVKSIEQRYGLRIDRREALREQS
jgi:hypothetical protein